MTLHSFNTLIASMAGSGDDGCGLGLSRWFPVGIILILGIFLFDVLSGSEEYLGDLVESSELARDQNLVDPTDDLGVLHRLLDYHQS